MVLASNEQVVNDTSGTINVNGGPGEDSSSRIGAGGGGGGGFVHLISTSAPVNSGTISHAGGAAGLNSNLVTDSPRFGGSAGGSCKGYGGSGGNVLGNNTASPAEAGSAGEIYLTTASPTTLFW